MELIVILVIAVIIGFLLSLKEIRQLLIDFIYAEKDEATRITEIKVVCPHCNEEFDVEIMNN